MPSAPYHYYDGDEDGFSGGVIPNMEAPDVHGEVTGYRAWNVVAVGKLLRLTSATYGAHWPVDDWVVATCGNSLTCQNSDEGEIPGIDCSCGLYAARDLDQLVNLGYGNYTNEQDVVMGQVGMVGKVIPGQQGWRASHARVIKLLVPHTKWKLGAALAATYGVEYELHNTLRRGV